MTKLSGAQAKALRYLLIVEMHGPSAYTRTREVFGNWTPKGATFDSLVKRGEITELKTDGYGFVREGGEHKLTRAGYIELAYNVTMNDGQEVIFARKRLDEINAATKAQLAKNAEIKAEAEKIARQRHGVGYTVEQARAIEKELRTIESATPIVEAREVPTAAEVVEKIDGIAQGIVSAMTGLSPEEIRERLGSITGADPMPVIRTFGSFEEMLAAMKADITPESIELPALPEPRCGNVFYEEVQCTKEPFHMEEMHEYSPGYGLTNFFVWTEQERNDYFSEFPKETIEFAMAKFREARDESIRAKVKELELLANGDTSLPDLTERAKNATKVARELAEMNGFDKEDIIHTHDRGSLLQVCTALPQSRSVGRYAFAAAQRIAMDLGWLEGVGGAVPDSDCDYVSIVISEHAHQ